MRVEFHDSNGAAPVEIVAALVCRALDAGERVLVRAADAGQARTLDEHLWTLDRFVPHCLADDADQAAAWVVIAAPGQIEPERGCVLNLRQAAVVAPAANRIVELIPADEHGRQAARNRWREYLAADLKPVKIDPPKTGH